MTNVNYLELFSKAGEAALETAKQFAEINAKAGEKLLEQQVELAGQYMTAAARNAELLAKAKGYQDVVSGQAQIAQEYAQQVLAGYKRMTEIVTEAGKAASAAADQAAREARENLGKVAA